MWICRSCARHLNDDVLKCPCGARASLPPELAENISTSAETPSPQKDRELIKDPRLPLLKRQWQKPALDIGAFVGLLSFFFLLRGYAPELLAERTERSLAIILFIAIPVGGFFCVFVGAMIFQFLAIPAGAIVDWFDRRFHHRRDRESPVPHAVLAKTDSLDRRRRKRAKKSSGICDPRQSEQHAITDANSDIQADSADIQDR
jgi:hypothetical protein